MGKHFILDENIIRAALSCSQMANTLFEKILINNHALAVNIDLYNVYWKNLKRFYNSIHHPYLQPLIGQILRDSQKCLLLPGPFRNPSSIALRHRKDVFLAQIAMDIPFTAYIVTMDNKTRTGLNGLGLTAITLYNALSF